ncbi:MAG TPA: DUF975 family protein [Clostridia bacterium]
MKTCKEYRKIAGIALKQNFGKIIAFGILASMIIGALLSTSFGIIIVGPLYIGTMVFFLRAIRNEPLHYGALFEPFINKDFGRTEALFLLKNILICLWSLLLVIPGIIKSYSYAMADFIAVDNPNLRASDCISYSMIMMKGNKFKLFLLDLSFIGWYLLGILTLGIGFIFIAPYVKLAKAAFYEDLKAKYPPLDLA